MDNKLIIDAVIIVGTILWIFSPIIVYSIMEQKNSNYINLFDEFSKNGKIQ